MNTTTQLTIKTLDGAEHHINIQHTSYTSRTVAELVEQELHCAPSQYRLIPSPTSRDTYILVPLRQKEPSNTVDNSVHKGPSNEAIAQATSHFTSSQSSTNVQPAVIQEVIIIFICNIYMCARVMIVKSYYSIIFNYFFKFPHAQSPHVTHPAQYQCIT